MKRYHQSYGWWGGHGWWHTPESLSLIELIEARTLDLPLAALLWQVIEQKGSIIIASEPPMAGKTTLLTALISMIPPWFETVFTWGYQEDFQFLKETDPAKTYIMVNEISDHLPTYLWGSQVRTVFEALGQGYSLGATMHDETPEGILKQLLDPPLSIPPAQIAKLHLILLMEMSQSSSGVRRRISSAHLVLSPEKPETRKATFCLASLNAQSDILIHSDAQGTQEALASRLGRKPEELRQELALKRRFLEELCQQSVTSINDVRQGVLDFYTRKRAPG